MGARVRQVLVFGLVIACSFLYMSYLWTVRVMVLQRLEQEAVTIELPHRPLPPPLKVIAKTRTLSPSLVTTLSPSLVTTPSTSSYFNFSPHKRYFFYQPSGGWGNQRFILRWAILAANAMNRTLAVCPMAPHSDIWHGYNAWEKQDMVPADQLLDVRALNEVVNRGVVFLDDIPLRIVNRIQNETTLQVEVFVKGHYVNRFSANKRLLVYNETDIARDWLDHTAQVVFWDKMSMWQCCTADFGGDTIWLGKHIMFNTMLKQLVLNTTRKTFGVLGYNAVHIRRGDMTITSDRKSAEVYYKKHRLHLFDSTLPLYVATNERNASWFDYLHGKFPKLKFWKDLELDRQVLQTFPPKMQGDVAGFIDMLVCGNAIKWEGSLKSTFSAAIGSIRLSPQLRELEWEFPIKPSLRLT
ncbi:hypothetical protein BASA81_010803 [Batrachochytrium salamandrivorans]|nr:hypothetical protein BASA81_010803 [Batrachochytrium salamandrivorans]